VPLLSVVVFRTKGIGRRRVGSLQDSIHIETHRGDADVIAGRRLHGDAARIGLRPPDGHWKETLGGVVSATALLTFTEEVAVALFPPAFLAIACRVWPPLLMLVVFHVQV
jgi:hypothetical protein